MGSLENTYKKKEIGEWMEFMKSRLDRYEVERNEYTADYKMPPRNVMFYRQVVLPFAENTLIMDNIAASEGVRYNKCGCQNKLIINYFINGMEVKAEYPDLACYKVKTCCNKEVIISYPNHFPYLVKSNSEKNSLEASFNNKKINKDFEVCLPSEHAFYSILENVIRNSAKHNKEKLQGDDKRLEICISIFDKNDDHYEINIYDNVSAVTTEQLARMVAGKRQSLLDESGQTRRENLGIADMKINAHLLRSVHDINDEDLAKHLEIVLLQSFKDYGNGKYECSCSEEDYFPLDIDPNLKKEKFYELVKVYQEHIEEKIKAKKVNKQQFDLDNKNGGEVEQKALCYRFGYRFHLAKSKKVCWLGEVSGFDEKLKKKGIYHFKDWKSFTNQKDGSLAAFQFAIFEPDLLNDWNKENELTKNGKSRSELEDELEEMLLRLPFRVLYNSKDDPKGILKEFIEQRRIQQVENRISIEALHKDYKKETVENGESQDMDYLIIKSCWENWLKRWGLSGSKKAELLLYSENTLSEWNNVQTDENKKFKSCLFDFQYAEKSESSDSGFISNPKLTPKIFFDHHGGSGCFNTDQDFSTQNAYISFDKNNPDYATIFLNKASSRWHFPYQLAEAGLLRVLILDERLAEYAVNFSGRSGSGSDPLRGCKLFYEDNIKDTFLADVAQASNITIATHLNGSPLAFVRGPVKYNLRFAHTKQGVCACIKSNVKSNGATTTFKCFDAIIIHRTYLNDEYKSKIMGGKSVKQFITELKRNIPLVILTSGGGIPHSINPIFKFMSLNVLQRFFVEKNMGKLSLTSTITSIIKNQ